MIEGYIEKSFDATDEELEKINKFTRAPFDADRLYTFSVVLCSNDIDRDFERFSVDALNELAERFIGKTGIKDHSMKSADQKARVYDTWIEKCADRKTSDGEELYLLKAKAYMLKNDENMPLIEEIEAGIKKEVSISCAVAKSVCSICGTDRKASHCEHIAGRKYGGKTAFRTLSDITDAYEFSFVAIPAQRDAGVTKKFSLLKKDSDSMTDIIKAIKACDEELVMDKSQLNSLKSYIDKLEDEAEVGRACKKALANEVVALCAEAMPEMDIKIFAGIAQVMTSKELEAFKSAFKKSKSADSAKLQLGAQANNNYNFDQFKI